MTHKHLLNGLIAAPFTPMNADGSVNLPKIKDCADFLADKGCVNGVFICGTTGEYASTTVAERKAVTETWVREAAGRFKVVAHVGSNCAEDAAELARHARETGVDAVASIAPNYFRPSTVRDLIEFMKPIAAAAGDLPFYFYNIPSMSGVRLSLTDFLIEGKKEMPNLAGVKFSDSDFYAMQLIVNLSGGEFNILNGSDEMLIAGLACGAQGAVGSTYNYVPGIYQNVIDALAAGDLETARKWQWESVRIVKVLIDHGGGTRAGKAFMKLAGVDCGQCRPPISPVSDEEMATIEKELKETLFFDFV